VLYQKQDKWAILIDKEGLLIYRLCN
jgi:hypothetical protein